MSGLSRFDFYPRDWFLDTRDLTNAAKGVYIDLLATIYARGGAIPENERELCRLTGCATARSLRPLLSELIAKGKLRLVNGAITNGRAEEEIAKFESLRTNGGKGGKSRSARVRGELGSNSARTHAETADESEQKQQVNIKPPSPSPSPSPIDSVSKDTGADAPSDAPKKALYDLGRKLLGKRPGGQVTRLLQACQGDIAHALDLLRQAESKSSPSEWIAGVLRRREQADADGEPTVDEINAQYEAMGVML